jgi:hypothetical protein
VDESDARPLPRLSRYLKFLEFQTNFLPCADPSCGCSVLADPAILQEILRDSLRDTVVQMLVESSQAPHLNQEQVSKLMISHLKPLYDFLVTAPNANTTALVPPLLACTALDKFHLLLHYCNERKEPRLDVFYPLFKLVWTRNSRPFDHLELLFTLLRVQGLNHTAFRHAQAIAVTDCGSAKWLTWFKYLFQVGLAPRTASENIWALAFLISFPPQQNLSSADQALWKDLFALLTSQSSLSVLFPSLYLLYHKTPQAQWVSHVEVIFKTSSSLVVSPALAEIARVLLDCGKFDAIARLVENCSSLLVTDRVDVSKRQNYQAFLTLLKGVVTRAGNVMEWNALCQLCARLLTSKKKVQEVVKAAMIVTL